MQRQWISSSLKAGALCCAALCCAALVAADAQGISGTTESCQEGYDEYVGKCVYLSAQVLLGGWMLAPDHAQCQQYPCIIRFYTNCADLMLGAEGWVQTAAPNAFPHPWVPKTYWKTDPWLWISRNNFDPQKIAFYVDWYLPSDRNLTGSFHHSNVRLFRSGTAVKSETALKITEW